jgi:hypothetical protein
MWASSAGGSEASVAAVGVVEAFEPAGEAERLDFEDIILVCFSFHLVILLWGLGFNCQQKKKFKCCFRKYEFILFENKIVSFLMIVCRE